MKTRIIIMTFSLIVAGSASKAQHIKDATSGYSGDIYHDCGNVGIGTSSPSVLLDIESSSETDEGITINHDYTSDPQIRFLCRGTARFTMGVDNSDSDKFKIGTTSTSTNTRMTINSSGDVGIGTSSPSYIFELYDNVSSYVARFRNDGNNQYSQGLRIRCGADNGSGTTTYFSAEDGDGTAVGGLRHYSGTFQLFNVSDIRTKTNVKNTTINGIEIIKDLRVVDFNRVSNPDGNVIHGFIAQEVEPVYPDVVSHCDESRLLGISKAGFVPVLVKAIQEQQVLIKENQDELQQIGDEITKIANKIKELDIELTEVESNKEKSNNAINDQNVVLHQNDPNPFKEKSIINYNLSENIKEAYLEIHDINGKIVKKIRLVKGLGFVTIFGSDLSQGTYTYSIIANGNVIDTKKMVVTK